MFESPFYLTGQEEANHHGFEKYRVRNLFLFQRRFERSSNSTIKGSRREKEVCISCRSIHDETKYFSFKKSANLSLVLNKFIANQYESVDTCVNVLYALQIRLESI